MTQPQAIQRVRSLVDGEPVQDYDHRWARDERGRLWVRKRELDTGVEVLAAEIIGWHLARYLDVPVPDAAVYRDAACQHATSFLSAAVQPVLHWDSDKEIFLNNLEDLGNVLVLDAIILNGDRHARNLLLEPDPDEFHLRLWSIDTGNALIGSPADFLAHADDVPLPMFGLNLPVARVRQRAVQTAQRAMTISGHHLARVVHEASESQIFPTLHASSMCWKPGAGARRSWFRGIFLNGQRPMSAEFRIVHFVSDPFLGTRIPVAALLRDRTNVVRVVRAQRLPGPECLGGPKYAAALRMVLDSLDNALAFDRLPQSVGPFATMAEPLTVPHDVFDAAKWLGSYVLPTPATAVEAAHHREPKRARVGYRFFESWGLHRYVKKEFKIKERWNSVFESERSDSSSIASIDSISHWIEGSSQILLMEPLIPGRASFQRDLHGVARSFSAFRFHLERLELKKDISLVAYVLRSRHRERRDEAIVSLRDIAHEIVDLSDSAAQEHFVHEVRTVGESGSAPR